MWKPKGGIFLWLKLPDQVDVTKLVAARRQMPASSSTRARMVVQPGASEVASAALLRAAVEGRIRDGVAAFARVCYEETGIPEQSANIRRPAAPRS